MKRKINVFFTSCLICLIIAIMLHLRIRLISDFISNGDIVTLSVLQIPLSPFREAKMVNIYEYDTRSGMMEIIMNQYVRRFFLSSSLYSDNPTHDHSVYVITLWTETGRHIIYVNQGNFVIDDFLRRRNNFIAIDQTELFYKLNNIFLPELSDC